MMKGSIAVFTLVAFLSAPLAHAQPAPQPRPADSSPALNEAAKKGLPFAIPGIGIGVTGGVMLSSAIGAAATAGTALTVSAVALPVVLLAAGIGLVAWGSWRAYKALTAKGSPIGDRPSAPGSSPGRTEDAPQPTNPNPGTGPGNGNGNNPVRNPIDRIWPEGTGRRTGSNVGLNSNTNPPAPGAQPGAPSAIGGAASAGRPR